MSGPGVEGTITTPSSKPGWDFYSMVSNYFGGVGVQQKQRPDTTTTTTTTTTSEVETAAATTTGTLLSQSVVPTAATMPVSPSPTKNGGAVDDRAAAAGGSSYESRTNNDRVDAATSATATATTATTMTTTTVNEQPHHELPPSSLDQACRRREKRKQESSPSSSVVDMMTTTDQTETTTTNNNNNNDDDDDEGNHNDDDRRSNAQQQDANTGQKKRHTLSREEEEIGDKDNNGRKRKRHNQGDDTDSVAQNDDDDDQQQQQQQDSTIREQIRASLAGAALVFRFGKPSTKPVSHYEKETLEAALENEEEDEDRDEDEEEEKEGDSNKATLNNPESYFESIGVHVKDEIIDEGLEEQVIERIIDILIEQRNTRSVRNRGRISFTSSTTTTAAVPTLHAQPFTCPDAVANRELYFVTTKSCKRMKQAMGRPFEPLNKSHFAWYVQNMDIAGEGVGVDGDTSANALLTRSSAICRSGNGILPDVEGMPNHTQNLNNPLNQAFLEVLQRVQEYFGKTILWTGSENQDGKKENHRFKCLQLILAEHDRKLHYAVGERGLHQDKWSTTGAAIIGVTIGPGSRRLKMQHRSLHATYDLKRRSAYIISGAARYGTLWTKRGLISPIKHGLSRFTTTTTNAARAASSLSTLPATISTSSTTTTSSTSSTASTTLGHNMSLTREEISVSKRMFRAIVDPKAEEYWGKPSLGAKMDMLDQLTKQVWHLPHLVERKTEYIRVAIRNRIKTVSGRRSGSGVLGDATSHHPSSIKTPN